MDIGTCKGGIGPPCPVCVLLCSSGEQVGKNLMQAETPAAVEQTAGLTV